MTKWLLATLATSCLATFGCGAPDTETPDVGAPGAEVEVIETDIIYEDGIETEAIEIDAVEAVPTDSEADAITEEEEAAIE